MQSSCAVTIRFFPPPKEIQRYFTTFYLTEIAPSAGQTVTDYLQPEWANLRFHSTALLDACGGSGEPVSGTCFSATGPSAAALRFTVGPTRIWGVGLLPLGWARYVPAPAAALANMVVDGHAHPAFADFTTLAAGVFGAEPDCEAEYARIAAHFLERPQDAVMDEDRIQAIHAALIDPEIASVAALAERVGGTPRTLERACHRAFGFSPKLLLRRQRFMRSLAQFMADPAIRWSGAMDGSYYDQAQFVRDCRQFLGMTPRQYAALDKPILAAVMRERARISGAAVQTLDGPKGGAVAG